MSTTIASGTNAISSDLMAAVNPKTSTTAATDTVAADTNKFLTLLVTQLQNQDPMNPLDNAQITSQLAQLSTVTGVNKLNTTLDSLKSSYQSSETLQAASMIGRGVLSAGSDLTLSGGNAVLGVDLATAADSVQVVVRDSSGKQIHAIDLGAQKAGTLPLAWDGALDNSTGVAADGKYSFEVVAMRGGQKLTDATALAYGTVASVSTNAQGVKLNLPSGASLALADVKQIL